MLIFCINLLNFTQNTMKLSNRPHTKKVLKTEVSVASEKEKNWVMGFILLIRFVVNTLSYTIETNHIIKQFFSKGQVPI